MRDQFYHPHSDRSLTLSPSDVGGGGGGGGGQDASSARTPSDALTMPDALRGPDFDRMYEAWGEARRKHDPELPAFTESLKALARHARATNLDVSALLKALDSVTRPESGGEQVLDWDHVREIAGRVVIRAYYRDD